MSSPAPERIMPLPLLMKTAEVARNPAKDAASADLASDPASVFDAALLTRMASRDQVALAELFDRYSRMILGIAYRVLHDRGESEELVQDVFLHIYQNAARHDPTRGSVKAWMVQLAYYRALNRRLFLSRRRFYDGTDLEGVENNVVDDDNPELDLLSKEGHENIEKAFADLTARQRMTLELFFVEGLTLREISQRIDEPLANVRHHYYRGLEKLRASSVVAKIWNDRV